MSDTRNRKKKVLALATLGVFAFSGGMAIAYYTTQIDVSRATGTATVSPTGASNIVATFVSGPTLLVPGAPAQPLVLSLTNNNPYAVAVGAAPLSLDFATMTSDKLGCAQTQAQLTADAVALTGPDAMFDAGVSRDVTFSVAMEDSPDVDQTPCIGAQFTIPVKVG